MPGVDFMRADLADPDALLEPLCAGMDTVFHVAALSASWGRRTDFEAANVQATARLLDAAVRTGVSRFVFISSPSIYADFRDRIALTEEDAPTAPPLNDYARTKLAAEKLVQAAAQPGFATLSIRPRAIVGPDDQVLLPRLAAIAERGRMPLLRGGEALIEMTDVRDVVAALIAGEAAADALPGETVNISGGRPVSVRTVSEALSQAMGRPMRYKPVPMTAVRSAARIIETFAPRGGREPLLTRYTLATLGYSQTFNLAKARNRLGFAPRHDALETLLAVARARYA